MSLEVFLSTFAKVEYLPQHKHYGLHPFALVAIDALNKVTVAALDLNDVRPCYFAFLTHIKKSKSVYMVIDFPKGLDIKNDFLGVFIYENNALQVFAIPYNIHTGEMYERIDQAKILQVMKRDVNSVIKEQLQALYN